MSTVGANAQSEHRLHTPSTVDELCAILARCDRDGTPIAIVGGDTLRGMGFPRSGSELVVQTALLKKIVAYGAADMTVGVQCGCSLRTLATRLRRERQFVPFDAPKPSHATVGGTLAAGWLGPRRHKFGRLRDFIIGSTIGLADGTLARAGGMVVKNVAGYDMSRLYVGSFGTLGVLVQANLKTLPLPQTARAFLAPLPEMTRSRAFAQLRALQVEPSAALWIDGFEKEISGEAGPEGRLFVLLESSEALMERATRDLRSALGRAGVPETKIIDDRAYHILDTAIDAYVSTVADRSVTYRVPLLPDRVESAATEVRDIVRRFALDANVIADVMNGDVIARASRNDTRDLSLKFQVLDDTLHQVHPRSRIIAGNHPVRGALRVWGDDAPAIARMQALKAQFDPRGTLNPGRFVI